MGKQVNYYAVIKLKEKICSSLAAGSRITSLCPALGKMHVQVFNGMCPGSILDPVGKKLNVAFLGGRPHINYMTNPISGTDFILTKLFSKKHGFIPKFLPTRTLDMVTRHKPKGLIYWV